MKKSWKRVLSVLLVCLTILPSVGTFHMTASAPMTGLVDISNRQPLNSTRRFLLRKVVEKSGMTGKPVDAIIDAGTLRRLKLRFPTLLSNTESFEYPRQNILAHCLAGNHAYGCERGFYVCERCVGCDRCTYRRDSQFYAIHSA